jgi:PhnB protein
MTGPGQAHIRHGRGAVRPYLYGRNDLIEFVKHAFAAEELERSGDEKEGFHVELQIGDSVIVLETGDSFPGTPTKASVYVYVPDVDAAYRRALDAGASSVEEPQDKPYQERVAGVRDSFGNTWYISTYAGDRP